MFSFLSGFYGHFYLFRCLCFSIDSRVEDLLLLLSFVLKNIQFNYHKFLPRTHYGYHTHTKSGIRGS